MQNLERKALIAGAVANVSMAVAGWFTFYLTDSEAILLDANFCFILFFTSLLALWVAKVKSRTCDNYPYGLYIIEVIYILMKGLLIFGVIITAFTTNAIKVVHYFSGTELAPIKPGLIIYYGIFTACICFSLSWFYRRQNKLCQMRSGILFAESKATMVGGWMSLSMGLGLFAIGLTDPNGPVGFSWFIGDAMVVMVLGVLLIKNPWLQIKQAALEMLGGKHRDADKLNEIDTLIRNSLPTQLVISDVCVFKTGSFYLVVVYIDSRCLSDISMQPVTLKMDETKEKLSAQYGAIRMEVALR